MTTNQLFFALTGLFMGATSIFVLCFKSNVDSLKEQLDLLGRSWCRMRAGSPSWRSSILQQSKSLY